MTDDARDSKPTASLSKEVFGEGSEEDHDKELEWDVYKTLRWMRSDDV